MKCVWHTFTFFVSFLTLRVNIVEMKSIIVSSYVEKITWNLNLKRHEKVLLLFIGAFTHSFELFRHFVAPNKAPAAKMWKFITRDVTNRETSKIDFDHFGRLSRLVRAMREARTRSMYLAGFVAQVKLRWRRDGWVSLLAWKNQIGSTRSSFLRARTRREKASDINAGVKNILSRFVNGTKYKNKQKKINYLY